MKLSDTQLVVLSAACQRPERNVLPLPESLKGGAAHKVIGSLLGNGLVEEVAAMPGAPIWRIAADGAKVALVTTAAAFQALGIEPEVSASGEQANAAPHAAAQAGSAESGTDDAESQEGPRSGEVEARPRKSRANSKQAQLIAMLQKPDGASLDEIVAATGWQAHTVRGAIAGALKKKLGLSVTSEKIEGRGRVYRLGI